MRQNTVKVKLSILTLIILLMAGAYSFLFFIKWDEKKAELIRVILEDTGINLSIDSKVTVQSFPRPGLSVENIKGSVNQGEDKIIFFMSQSAKVQFSIIDLFKGQFKISKLEFDNGTISLDSKLISSNLSKITNNSASLLNQGVNHFFLKSFTFNGEFAGEASKIANIDAEIDIGSDLDSFAINGSCIKNNGNLNFAIKADSKVSKFNLKLFKANGFVFDYNGTLEGGVTNFASKGKLNIELTDVKDGGIFMNNPLPFLGYISSDLINNSNFIINGEVGISNGDLLAKGLKISSKVMNGEVDYSYLTLTGRVNTLLDFKLNDLDLSGMTLAHQNDNQDTGANTIELSGLV